MIFLLIVLCIIGVVHLYLLAEIAGRLEVITARLNALLVRGVWK